MFEAAFAAVGLEGWSYQRLPAPPELFAETALALEAAGFAGANVTIPHKEAALALAGEATPEARAIGAANTLTFGEGRVEAANTDAPGLIAALPEPPAGRRALVLGAGGSARAAAYALGEAGAEVLVHNRTRERAEKLASTIGAQVVAEPEPADLLVNCTSVGLEDSTQSPVDEIRWPLVVDLVYGDRETALLRAARAAGSAVVDGLEVLVQQGALSFAAWTGLEAPLAAMRAAVRER
jgi:shikimate dehydrogenase